MFEQERVISRLQRRVMADPAILASFLGGSHGRNANDAYSAIDAALVFRTDSARDRAWAGRREFAQSVMPYVPVKGFDAEHLRAFFYITLFANGSKVDYRFESAESLKPVPMDGRIRILKDTGGFADSYRAQCARLNHPIPSISSEGLEEIDERFWIMFWDVLRLLARGPNDNKAFPIYLHLLWSALPPLLRALPPEDSARQALTNVHFSRDMQATEQSLIALLDAYLAARATIVRLYHLQPVGDSAFEAEIRRHIQRLV